MSYLWAGYLLTWVAIAWYAWRLESRLADAERRLEGLAPERPERRDPSARTGSGSPSSERP